MKKLITTIGIVTVLVVGVFFGTESILKPASTSGVIVGDVVGPVPPFKFLGNSILPRGAGYDFALGSATATSSAPFSWNTGPNKLTVSNLTVTGTCTGCSSGGSAFSGLYMGEGATTKTHIDTLTYSPSSFNFSPTASAGILTLDYSNGPASRSLSQTWTGTPYFSSGASFSATTKVSSLYDSAGNNVVTLRGGSVGIGTTGPTAKLMVVAGATGSAGLFQVDSTATTWSGTNAALDMANANATTNNHALFQFSDNTGGTGTAGFGAKFTDRTNHYGDVYIWTKGTDGYNQRLYVQSGGNVGIGTTAPGESLHIKANETGAGTSLLRLDNGGTFDNEVGMEFFTSASDSTTSYRVGRIYGMMGSASYLNARLTLQSMTTGNTLVDTLSLKNGNVGIGTTNPDTKLEVFNGNLKIGDDANTARSLIFERNSLTIGTIDTTGSNLVIGAANGKTVSIWDDGNNGINVIDGGNVGIGTTAPRAKLDVEANMVTANINDLIYGATTGAPTFNTAVAHFAASGTGAGTGANSTFGVVTTAVGAAAMNVAGNFVASNGTNNIQLLLGTSLPPAGSYGIYNSSTANNYIAGNVGIGTTGPGSLLQLGAGSLTWVTDNTQDIGANGATRPRTLYLGTSVIASGIASNSFAGSLSGPTTGTLSVGTSNNPLKTLWSNIVRAVTSFFFPTTTTTSLTVAGQAVINTASGSFDFNDGTNTDVITGQTCFTYVVDAPTASNPGFVGLKRFNDPFTLTSVQMVASGSNSAGWNLKYGVPGTITTSVWTANKSASSSTAPTYTSFTNSTLTDGNVLEVAITSRSAVLQTFSVNVCGRYTH